MNPANTQQHGASEPDAFATTQTRLSGPWLIVVRSVWLALVVPNLGLFVAGLPAYYTQVQRPCVDPQTCEVAFALTAKGLQSLAALGFSVSGYAAFLTVFFVIIILIWSGVGLLIFRHRSDDWVALLTAFVLVMFNLSYPGLSATALSMTYPILVLPVALISFFGQFAFIVLFLLFPSGRFVPRWTIFIIPLVIVQNVSWIIPPTSPFHQNHWPDWLNGVLPILIYGTVIISQVYRYRRVSSLVERQQTKWAAFGITAVVIGLFTLGLVFTEFFPEFNRPDTPYVLITLAYPIILLVLPISVGIAILRYRLWDVDVIIRRTVTYGLLTALLLAVYFGGVVTLQQVFDAVTGQRSEVAIILSTLAIAVLFVPLRNRIQRVIDRRFYRRKYNAERALEAFALTARDETDPNRLSADLLDAVDDTLQPTSVLLMVRQLSPTGREVHA